MSLKINGESWFIVRCSQALSPTCSPAIKKILRWFSVDVNGAVSIWAVWFHLQVMNVEGQWCDLKWVCHRVSASVREITASGCRVFCKRATRGQLLPFLWNNKDGRPQSISLPENTALQIFGPDIRSCVWVCHCWTLCSKRQCQGGFHLRIPLEAQLHRTTPKTIREHSPALCNT